MGQGTNGVPSHGIKGTKATVLRMRLPKAAYKNATKIAKEHNATCFMVLVSAFCVLWHGKTGEKTIRVGTMAANRLRAGTAGIIGLLANTISIECTVESDSTFATVLQGVVADALETYVHQELPFDTVADLLRREGVLTASLLRSMLLFHETDSNSRSVGRTQFMSIDEELGVRTMIDSPTAVQLSLEISVLSSGELDVIAYYLPQFFERDDVENFVKGIGIVLSLGADDDNITSAYVKQHIATITIDDI
jgi:hypothetical protein